MDTKDYLLGEIKKLNDRAQAIVDTAEKAVRDNTEEEMEEIKSILTKIEEKKLEVARIERHEATKAQLAALGAVTETVSQEPVQVQAKTPGDAVVNSAEYQAVVKQANAEGMPKFTLPTIELKAVTGAVLESDGNNNDAIAPTWDPNLYAPGFYQFPLRVADLLTVSQVDRGNSVNYPVVTARTAPTGNPTDEGEDKKLAGFGFDFVTKVLVKNTAFVGVSEEMFQDASVIASYINNQLGLMVMQEEEIQITQELYDSAEGTGGGGAVDGTEIGGDNGFDAIRAAINVVQLNGAEPDGILIHPNDAAFLDVQRAVAGDGNYFGGGPFGGPRTSVWGGLRYVITPKATQGTAIVGAFRVGATLYRKGGLRVDTSNSHDDWFRKNLIAIRAEIRSITGVHNPELFVEAVLSSS